MLQRTRPKVIASTLERTVAGVNEWDEIGRAARKVFLENFFQAHFRRRLLEALSRVLSPAQTTFVDTLDRERLRA